MSNDKTFDQDNVFGEPNTVFESAGTSRTKSPADKKKGKLPVWILALIGAAGLLMLFVIFRLVVGGGSDEAPIEDLAPIAHSMPQEVAPAPTPGPAPQPGVAPAPPVSPPVVIPGDEPTPGSTPFTGVPAVAAAAAASAGDPAGSATPASEPQPASTEDEHERLKQRIEALSVDVSSLKQQLRNRQRAQAPAPRRQASAPKAPEPIVGLTLKAIVENSAWLQTSSGETVMVQTGDRVEGVGLIQAIDPDAGVIRFTDGRVLR